MARPNSFPAQRVRRPWPLLPLSRKGLPPMLPSLIRRRGGTMPLAPKVPEITVLFWIIKILTTGMGEGMSDFLGQKSVPLAGAIGVFGFAIAMRMQLSVRAYRAPV